MNLEPRVRPGPRCTVELIESTGLRRVLKLAGSVNALLDYDVRALGREVLRVDGREVVRASPLLGYHPRFQFTLPGRRGRVPASLEVEVDLWNAITALRLRVGAWVVYSEGVFTGEGVSRDALPIPSSSGREENAGLPHPASAPQLIPETLPLPGEGSFPDLETLPLESAVRVRRARALLAIVGALGLVGLGVGIAGGALTAREATVRAPGGEPQAAEVSEPTPHRWSAR